MKAKVYFLFMLLALTLRGFAQWSPTNTPVCTSINDQQEVRLVTDDQGGAILTWVDYRLDGQLGDVYAQRLNAAGLVQWTLNGLGICTEGSDQGAVSITEDGAGGAIMSWNDRRSGNRDVYAQKVDAAGAIQWTANGAAVAVKAGDQQDSKLISDGMGGAIIVWQDSTTGSVDVYAQRMSSSGVPMWTAGGVVICNATNTQINPRLETDGVGGAIFTWQDKRGGANYDIYAQRVDYGGNVQWAANGVAVCNAAGTQSNPKIESDGAGGAYICWQDKRGGDYDVYAQRLSSTGAMQWTANGVAVCAHAGSQAAIDMTAKGGVNGAVLVWRDDRNGNDDIFAQRIDPAGAVQWTAGGIAIASNSGTEAKPNIVGVGSGNTIVVWQDSTAGNWNVLTAKRDANGAALWSATVSADLDNQTNPKNVTDGNGGCIYAWQDKRNLVDFNIYAHHLYSDGSLILSAVDSEPGAIVSLFPNPLQAGSQLEVTLPAAEDVMISLVDVTGRRLAVLHEGNLPAGSSQFRVPVELVARGMYFCWVQGNGWRKVIRCIQVE